ncbi:MAG TPA: hypothetical protein VJL78_08095 [Candidatus Nitrosocosmicus sp.]|nr:hypothetical protein [Candidatus Nitrosocosmicus sp.]
MDTLSCKPHIFLIVTIFITAVGILLFTGLINEKPLLFLNLFAQELSDSVINSSNISSFKSDTTGNNSMEQNDSKTVVASGHFANNQMKDGVVTWIQGGFWNLGIDNSSKIENTNASANFDANFTMIRPDGSLSHNHVINNFTSTNVIFAGNDIVITGISDINSNNGTEYEQVPMTIHLMGKRVLGLMIDVNKTGGHFAGSNEMFGTLISGIGLESSDINDNLNSNNLTNSKTPLESNSASQMGSLNHPTH